MVISRVAMLLQEANFGPSCQLKYLGLKFLSQEVTAAKLMHELDDQATQQTCFDFASVILALGIEDLLISVLSSFSSWRTRLLDQPLEKAFQSLYTRVNVRVDYSYRKNLYMAC